MPRKARIVIPGAPHHVTHRGNNGGLLFATDRERAWYLRALKEESQEHHVKVIAWCLMSNHVHLVLVPKDEKGLQRAVGIAHKRFSHRSNRERGQSGHLWGDRYFSCPMDDRHLVAAVRYVEQNPLRAGLATVAESYRWSSAAGHCGGSDSSGLTNPLDWARHHPGHVWRKMLAIQESETNLARIRASTLQGQPLVSDERLVKLETAMGRALRVRGRGRPARERDTEER